MAVSPKRVDTWRSATGPRKYILLSLFFGVSTGISYLLLWLGNADVNLTQAIPWLVGALVVAITLSVLFFEYAFKLRKQITGTRVGLAELRVEGVEIRNKGIPHFGTLQEWSKWEQRALDWDKRVMEEIDKINESDALWYQTLDVVPTPRVPQNAYPKEQLWSPLHIKLYREHDFRVMHLGVMIRELWRD